MQSIHGTVFRRLAILAAVPTVWVLTLFGVATSVDAADRVLKFAHVLQTDHPYHLMAMKFKEEIEARKMGLAVQVFPAGQLGNESTLIEGLQIGSVDVSTITSAVTAKFVPEFQVFSLPFIFRDAGHLFRVMDSEIGDEIAGKMLNAGLVKIGYGYGGTRDVYTHDPVRKLADLKGKKIRTMETTAIIDTWNALGAIATPIAWSDVPVSLKQRLIDGAEGAGVSYRSMTFYKDAKYFTRLAYIISWHNVMMSKKVFDSLTPAQRQAVLDAGKIAEVYERQVFLDQEAALYKELRALGAEIIDPEDRPDWVAKIQSVYEKSAGKVGGMDRINKILKF